MTTALSDNELSVEVRDSIQIITINRPRVRNAINAAVAQGIAAAIDELDADDDLRVGVLTGAGGTFSAGVDLAAYLAGERAIIADRGLCGITRTPPRKPLIAAVEGWAVGGGFELLLACDLVVAARSSRLGTPEVARSLVAGAGGALLLSQRIPQAFALEMLLTGTPITAARAAEAGLINRLVDEGSALDSALDLAATIAGNGPLAVVATKLIARSSRHWGEEEGWASQEEILRPVLDSEDAREGATAFVEKRPPRWRGR